MEIIGNTLGLYSFADKIINRLTVNVFERSTVVNNLVPRASHLPENKVLQSCTIQFLQCAAGTEIVLSLVADGHIARSHVDFYIILSVFIKDIHFHYNAQERNYFVRNIFRQLMSILHTAHFAFVVYADIEFAALCISKAA